MSYQIADDTETPRITPAVQWLIAINVAIFFLQLTVVRPSDVQQTLGSTRVQLALLFGALCALPTILALWWAPALVVFQDARMLTALRISLRAALANWRAALRYALTVFTLGAIVPMMLMTALAYVIPPPLNATLAALIVLPYLTFFLATLHISDYVSYRDVFHAGETLAPIAGAG